MTIAARGRVRRAADIDRSDGAGPFPVILGRTPCDNTAPSRACVDAARPPHLVPPMIPAGR